MGKRYQELYRLPSNLYLEGCPVIIAAGALQKDTVADKVLAQLKLRNLENKRITACKVTIRAFEPNGDEVEGISEFSYMDQSAGLGVDFGAKTPIYLPDKNTRRISAVVTEIVFADGSVWRSETCEWRQIPIPEQDKLAVKLPDEDLRDEYVREVGALCDYVPVIRNGLFQCACGTANLSTAEVCYNCRRSFDFLTEKMNPEYLAAQREIRLQREKEAREAAERAAAEAEEAAARKAAEEEAAARIAAEKARVASEEKKRKIKTIFKIAGPIIVAALIIAALTPGVIRPAIENVAAYRSAEQLLEEGAFDDAKAAFEALGDYRDAVEMSKEAVYRKADDMNASGKYEQAIAVWETIQEYCDSKARIEAAEYEWKEGDYQVAQELMDEKHYSEAVNAFSALKEYKDAKNKAAECRDLQNAVDYQNAKEAFEKGDYKKATDAFKKLGTYKDSEDLYKSSCYSYASKLLNEKNFRGAINYFNYIKGYKDADALKKETVYQLGCEYLSVDNYWGAIDQWTKCGDYKDALSKIDDAKYEYIKRHKTATDGRTTEYLGDLIAKDYSGAQDIYNEIYAWKAKFLAVNTDQNDTVTNYTLISKYWTWFAHFEITGGPPNGSVTPSYTTEWPDGKVETDTFEGSAYAGDYLWMAGGYGNPAYGTLGTVTITVYADDKEIGKTSFVITN